MNSLVTGAAGFIGSHLCDRLLALGHQVWGVDSFTTYYSRPQKEANIAHLRGHDRFHLIECDLAIDDLERVLGPIEIVFHLAAQPGVRGSWGVGLETYVRMNIMATQRLLEATRQSPVRRFLYASSSSVYGDAMNLPTSELELPQPLSPYGVTKLAGEQLAYLYGRSYGMPVVAVRYFTVYGPRQRPDMAFYRFIRAILEGGEIELYGDGEQIRDFTYVDDAVDGTVRAALSKESGQVFNIAGGSQVSLNRVITTLESLAGRRIRVRRSDPQRGDARTTYADMGRARTLLGYQPITDLATGLSAELDWLRKKTGQTSDN
jgi:nucleoside-diphosphate-sugar epimerase